MNIRRSLVAMLFVGFLVGPQQRVEATWGKTILLVGTTATAVAALIYALQYKNAAHTQQLRNAWDWLVPVIQWIPELVVQQ